MTTKHTPGPWKVNSHMGEQFVTGGNPSFLVAHVSNGRTHHGPDAENARLIAAAPDLLEALELIEIRLTYLAQDSVKVVDELKLARAAIAKAQGQQSAA